MFASMLPVSRTGGNKAQVIHAKRILGDPHVNLAADDAFPKHGDED